MISKLLGLKTFNICLTYFISATQANYLASVNLNYGEEADYVCSRAAVDAAMVHNNNNNDNNNIRDQ